MTNEELLIQARLNFQKAGLTIVGAHALTGEGVIMVTDTDNDHIIYYSSVLVQLREKHHVAELERLGALYGDPDGCTKAGVKYYYAHIVNPPFDRMSEMAERQFVGVGGEELPWYNMPQPMS